MKRFTFFLTLAVVFFGTIASVQAQRTSIMKQIRDFVFTERANMRGGEVPDAVQDRAEFFTDLMAAEFDFNDRQYNQVLRINRRYFGEQYAISEIKDEFSTEYNWLMNGTGRSFERGRERYQAKLDELESNHNARLMYFLKHDGFIRFQAIKPNLLAQVVDEFGEF